jgi:hypothetical protein
LKQTKAGQRRETLVFQVSHARSKHQNQQAIAIEWGSFAMIKPGEQIHEVARVVAILRVFESYLQVRRNAQHVHHGPQRKTAATVLLKAKVDLHALDTRA